MNDSQPTIPNATTQHEHDRYKRRATPFTAPENTMPMTTAQDTVPMKGLNATPETVIAPYAQKLPPPPAPKTLANALPRYRASAPVASKKWLWITGAIGMSAIAVFGISLLLVITGIYGRGILAQVSVGDVALGGLSIDEATQALNTRWNSLTLSGQASQTWQVSPADVGIRLDAPATAQQAFAIGRESGNALQAIFGRVEVAPVITFDIATAENYFVTTQDTYTIAPINAGVALINGNVQATPPQNGAILDIQATLANWNVQLTNDIQDGALSLVMSPVQPDILDASIALENARVLLANPLAIRVYDPITDNSVIWSVAPETWGTWLTAIPDSNSPIGLSLILQDAPLRDFLTQQATVFDASRYIDIEASVASIQQALVQGNPSAGFAIVKHNPTTHIVRSGESLTSIAWDYGIPYLYIQEANGGRDSFGVGESIVIPPADSFLLLPVVPDKRIVVSIPDQQVRVYENGQLIRDWNASTGIPNSPTWRGVYQIISHEPNAYAGNWDLNMPYFMGVYQPIPNAAFTNGFHGFPTRGGGQLLWENSIGTKVTYGCILLSNTNVEWLYSWAEEGVVVVIE
jgi:LysM repeat protein